MNVLRGVAALAAGAVLAAPASAAAAEDRVALTGTYRRMAVERADGHAYDDLLVTRGRTYRLRVTGARPEPGATVTLSASTTEVAGTSPLRATSLRTVSGAEPMDVTGTTTTLAILAYWTAPDSVTQARVQSQLFTDDASWIREASYGQTSLTGKVTPWVRIAAPTSGRCYDYADQIMARARTAAAAIGYDYGSYDRTLVYFPRCTGSDTTNLTGWAYEPGDSVWLNGVMDRRTSVHEHGHSFGLGHARSYACVSNGVRVAMDGTCSVAEYGDAFDAMGQSTYVGHFGGTHKDELGWLGSRKRVMTTSSGTYTLPPLERSSASPVVLVANSPVYGRRYWMEYRQPVGYDAKLPTGATAGLLVHLEDTTVGHSQYLLDMSPADGSMGNAVLAPGRTWTAPDGVRITAGTASTTGISVTVSGARPEPTPPSAPRLLRAEQGDTRALLLWEPPASLGNGEISRYFVTASNGLTRIVNPGVPEALFTGLTNGTTYTFTVKAENEAGVGPAATTSVTPRLSPPTVQITSPAAGSRVAGDVQVSATAAAGPNSLVDVEYVQWAVDGLYRFTTLPNQPFAWATGTLKNGPHTVTAAAFDGNDRFVTHTVTYDVLNPRPTVAITSPAPGAKVTGGVVTITADAGPAEDGATVRLVEFYRGGTLLGSDSTAPYEIPWDISRAFDGWHFLTARAYDTSGRSTVSDEVSVTVFHAAPTIRITSPAATSVSGTTLKLAADAASGTEGIPVSYVTFLFNGMSSSDSTAPYEASFDISSVSGPRTVEARVYETSGRSAYAIRDLTIDNALPVLTVTSPTEGAQHRGASLTITGTVAARGGAAVARLQVYSGFRSVNVVPAADGTWSVPWDLTGRYGQQSVVVRVDDTNGLWTSVKRTFYVQRPAPTVTLVQPTPAQTLAVSAPFDAAATVVHAPDATTTITSVCFVFEFYAQLGCATKQADGTWLASGLVVSSPGRRVIEVRVTESDGHSATYARREYGVMGPPPEASSAWAISTASSDALVGWSHYWPDPTYRPVREWVVRDANGVVLVRTTDQSATVGPLPAGVETYVSVEAVNEYGTSPRTYSSYFVPQWDVELRGYTYSRTSTTYPDAVTVRFQATTPGGAPVAGLRFELTGMTNSGYTNGLWNPVTSSTGWASVTFVPVASGAFTLTYEGADVRYRPFNYGSRYVTVASRVTGTLTRTTMTLGTTTWLNGRVQPATRGRSVYLQRYLNGAWRTVGYRGQNIDGTVAFAIKPTARGTYTYRLYYGGDGWRSPGASPGRTFTVT